MILLSKRTFLVLLLCFGMAGPLIRESKGVGYVAMRSFHGDENSAIHQVDNVLQRDAERLMEQLATRLESISDLQATVYVQADIPRVKVRPLTAEMFFLAPDRFRLRSARIALLPRQNPMELFEFLKRAKSYRTLAMGVEKVRNQPCLMINVLPLDGSNDWQLIRLWIHQETGQIYKAEMTRRNLGTVEAGYFYGPTSGAVPGPMKRHHDLPDSLLFEWDASMIKLPKALTADLHRSQSQFESGTVGPLGAPQGKARVAMGFRWTSVNNGAAARFFRAQKQD